MATCAPFEPSTAPTPHQRRATLIAENVALLDDTIVVMRFDPPLDYLMYYAAILQCTGQRPATFPTFWVASVVNFPSRHGALAFYAHDTHQTVFALGTEFVPWIVMHEMVHHALQATIPPGPDNESWDAMQRRTHPIEVYGGFSADGTYVHGRCETLVKPPPRQPAAPQDSSKSSSGART